MEENQHDLYIASKACQCNFVVLSFWFLLWNCLEKWIHLFLQNDLPTFGALMGDAFRTMIYCVHRKYPKISIFSEILLLCCLVKISVTVSRDWPWFIWNISIALQWMFQWWTETDPSSFRSSPEGDSLSFLISRRHLSCKSLMFCHSDGCEASKSVSSNWIVHQKRVN